jgi:hypothetical protein
MPINSNIHLYHDGRSGAGEVPAPSRAWFPRRGAPFSGIASARTGVQTGRVINYSPQPFAGRVRKPGLRTTSPVPERSILFRYYVLLSCRYFPIQAILPLTGVSRKTHAPELFPRGLLIMPGSPPTCPGGPFYFRNSPRGVASKAHLSWQASQPPRIRFSNI